MDDLQTLAAALHKPDPSREAVDEGRHRLQNAMRRPSRSRRTGWIAAGLSLTGAAAATAVVVTSASTTSPATPNGPPSPASARQVLLVAAESAARTPDGEGTYWHVGTVWQGGRSQRLETWTTRTGRSWVRGTKTEGRVVKVASPQPFGGLDLTIEQIEKLPADPAALKQRIAGYVRRSHARTSAGALTAEDREQLGFTFLVSLVSASPARAGTRAAAFRAIASYPDVKSLGEVDGGQGLEFSVSGHRARLVVDPATGRVRNTNFLVTPGGATMWIAAPGSVTITAGWTDTRPS